MKPQFPFAKRTGSAGSGEAGSTFVEVMAAMAILATIALVLWNGFFSSTEGFRNGFELLRRTGSVLQAKRLLDEELSRIRVPFWEKSADGFTLDSTELNMPFLDGERESVLSVSLRGGFLSVGLGDTVKTVRAGADASLSFLKGKDGGIPEGIVYTADGTELRIPFGSAGLEYGGGGNTK